MEIPHREIATTAAAKLVLFRLQMALSDTTSTKKEDLSCGNAGLWHSAGCPNSLGGDQ